jgi:SAM-dependent methyltransferase
MPRPSAVRIAELYNASYYESYTEGTGMAGGNFEASPTLRMRLQEVERRVGKGQLLDVGCGLGHFVKYAQDRGWSAAGLETSPWAASKGTQENGVVIHQCTLRDAPYKPGSLDVVHANHVVEHMLDPVAELKAARVLLRIGGLLVIDVPQELSWPLSDRLSHWLHPGVRAAPTPAPTSHLSFFTPKGLAIAAQRAGFIVQRVAATRHIRSRESRFPFGVPVKRIVYWLEELSQTAPDIELWAVAG